MTRQSKRNYDLKWAREWAGLTQAEAAGKIGVHRDTFNRWETGARTIPVRKFQLLLKMFAINPSDIPKQVEYDRNGYPLGFFPSFYGHDDEPDSGWDLDGEERELRKIEGSEYPVRERERYRLVATFCMPKEAADRYMTEYDEEQRRLTAGFPPRSEAEIHPGFYCGEEARAQIEEQMRAWHQDPEGCTAAAWARFNKQPNRSQEDRDRFAKLVADRVYRARNWAACKDLI